MYRVNQQLGIHTHKAVLQPQGQVAGRIRTRHLYKIRSGFGRGPRAIWSKVHPSRMGPHRCERGRANSYAAWAMTHTLRITANADLLCANSSQGDLTRGRCFVLFEANVIGLPSCSLGN
jgi:hypothetical protein